MSISSNSWFSSVYETWLGTSISQSTWESFLSDSDVQQVAANDTADYQKLYLQKLIATSFSQDAIVQALTQEAYPGATADQTKALIQAFFELPQVLALPSSATKQDYYDLYWGYLFETVLLNDPVVSAWFQSATEQFCGSVTSSQLQQIVATFLATKSVRSLPATATLEDYQRLFIQYLSSEINQTHIAEQVTGQSPEAVQQYKIVWTVFGLLSKMISAMSISQIRNAQAVQFLLQKRNEGASAYTRVPAYKGTGEVDADLTGTLKLLFNAPDRNRFFPSSVDSVYTPINVDTSDPTKFTLGYDNISLQEVSDWLYAQYNADKTKQYTFNLYSGDYITAWTGSTPLSSAVTYGSQNLALSVQTINGKAVITASLIQYEVKDPSYRNSDGTVNWEKELASTVTTTVGGVTITTCPVTTTTVISPVSITVNADEKTSITDAMNQAFISIWQSGTANGYIEPTATNNHLTHAETLFGDKMQAYFLAAHTPKIPWSAGILASSFVDDTDPSDYQKAYLTKLVQSRNTQNQTVSSQVSALTARMDVLKSLTDQQSQVQNASTSGLQMINNTIRAVILTMQQILSTLFA